MQPEIPAALAAEVDAWLAANAPDAAPDRLPLLVAASPFAAETLARYPDMLTELVADGRMQRAHAEGELAALVAAALADCDGDAAFQRMLRYLRHREMVRIAYRDSACGAPLAEVLGDLSGLADALINASLARAHAALVQRYGTPRDPDGNAVEPAVLAMGKLGGGELNFSSDIDLVFLFDEPGETDGARGTSNEEFFRHLARQVIDMLSRKTADGIVYRVDVRLRPFGDAGPLAVSLPALESYLLQHGRDWERYAYVKARVVNPWGGDDALHRDLLTPFVYRRYLDYGVFSSLREMKALIEAEGRRREYRDHLKLGPGGIREVEFIAQSLQLVRGGTLPALRERKLVPALSALAAHDCLPAEAVDELLAAYEFLRRAENRLQAIADRQTHQLPRGDGNRARLALAMGYAGWDAFRAALDEHRLRVEHQFRQIVFRGAGEDDAGNGDAWARGWLDGADGEALAALMERDGVGGAAAMTERLIAYRQSSACRHMDEPGRQRLAALMPDLVRACLSEDDPATALDRTMTVIEAIGRRSAYFALLNENPAALKRLVDLAGLSNLLARQLASHPLLLDELLDPRIYQAPPGRDEMHAELGERIASAGDDPERALDALRNFHQAMTFRVAVADLSGSLPLMKVSDRLTDIAELVLQAATDLAWADLARRHGRPRRAGGEDAHFAIVAYGKLGGLELGYGSDLDIVFLHDANTGGGHTDGERPLDNAVFFARLVQRIISILTMPTSSGPLYEVDIRLRPSGHSGLMVSSLAAFERYQREDAWTWEHQALLRSRAVAGDAPVREAFERLRLEALREFVKRDTLAEQVVSMRERMRGELDKSDADLADIKQGRGGIADIEFIVQYLVLRHVGEHPDLAEFSDNIRQLEALARHGILDAADTASLSGAYLEYRRQLHHLSLAERDGLVPHEQLAAWTGKVTAVWARVFEGAAA